MTNHNNNSPYWLSKTLDEMTSEEWEGLCDGCGRCCMHKLEDEETGDIYGTSVGCELLDGETCLCRDYPYRKAKVSDCIQLTRHIIETVHWLPKDCAYMLVAKRKDLEWWHYLKSGNRNTVHEAGISVRGQVRAYENQLHTPEDYLNYLAEKIYSQPSPLKK